MVDSLMADKRFWLNAAERAVLTFAQSLAAQLAVFEVVEIEEMKLSGLPWTAMLSVSAVAALISVLTTIGKGSAGIAGSGVDLQAERVEEPYAHDDFPSSDGELKDEVEVDVDREDVKDPKDDDSRDDDSRDEVKTEAPSEEKSSGRTGKKNRKK